MNELTATEMQQTQGGAQTDYLLLTDGIQGESASTGASAKGMQITYTYEVRNVGS